MLKWNLMNFISQKTKGDLKVFFISKFEKLRNKNSFFSGFRKGFLDFGQFIAGIINWSLLSFAYFIGIGLPSIIAKLLKKHFLETKFSEKSNSYWLDLNFKKRDIKEHYRQF